MLGASRLPVNVSLDVKGVPRDAGQQRVAAERFALAHQQAMRAVQRVLGAAGSYPTRPDVPGPTIPDGAPVVFPDWAAIGANRATILSEYQQAFGG